MGGEGVESNRFESRGIFFLEAHHAGGPRRKSSKNNIYFFIFWGDDREAAKLLWVEGGRAAPCFCVLMSLKRREHAVHGCVVRPKPTGILYRFIACDLRLNVAKTKSGN
jgi:hypothetical protein